MPINDPWLPSGAVPLNRGGIAFAVARFAAGSPGGGAGTFTNLPNVRCLAVHARIGSDPGSALFRYVFDGSDPMGPQSAEQALSVNFTGPHVVEINDRLVVQATRPDGSVDYIFDGYALTFGMVMDAGGEMVTIGCVGVGKRVRDTPIGGALIRAANHAAVANDYDVKTDVIAQFNPGGLPNATPPGSDSGQGAKTYPVFIDPAVVRSPDVRRPWDLAMAARFLMFNYNDETYINNPKAAITDTMLVAKEPADGVALDVNNPATYTSKPIIVPDTPITGKDWLGVLDEMVARYGFLVYLQCGVGPGYQPATALNIVDQRQVTAKPLVLQARGSYLDPAASNVGGCGLTRDLTELANQWTVQGGLTHYEASFVLAPGFPMASGDPGTVANYDRSGSAYFGANHDAYRLFVFDETGEGHYATGSATALTTVPQVTSGGSTYPALDDLFGAGNYASRRRKPVGILVSQDNNGKPYHARLQLALASKYTGPVPGIYDWTLLTGPLQTVMAGWELTKDRLGIRLTMENPNSWKAALVGSSTPDFAGGVVRVVEALATSNAKSFVMILTCVVEGDQAIDGTASRRPNSPIADVIGRTIDARDRYKKTIIAESSVFNDVLDDIAAPVAGKAYTAGIRDDTANAQAEADAVRAATEGGVLNGPVTIPRFTRYYQLGDSISAVEGRGMNLRTNTGKSAADDAPVYPVVVAIDWQLEPKQTTTLHLSDAQAVRKGFKKAIVGKVKAQHGHQ